MNIYLLFCIYSFLLGLATFFLGDEEFLKYFIIVISIVSTIFYGYVFKLEQK